MRKTNYQIVTKKIIKNWKKKKKREWKENSNFWIKIIRENLDPYRLVVTNKAVLECFKNQKKLKILDAGCGEGYLSRIMAKRGHQVFGIDSCEELIKAAKELERKKPLGIKYFLGDFRKTIFANSYFDLIVSHQTINEIENPEKAFKEFFRILKKRGKIILLFLHPCFEIKQENIKKRSLAFLYFNKILIEKGKYLVSGIFSPYPYFYLHLPLSYWTETLNKVGFLIVKIKEPHPSLKLLRKNKWWKENFQRPLFILIEAIKL